MSQFFINSNEILPALRQTVVNQSNGANPYHFEEVMCNVMPTTTWERFQDSGPVTDCDYCRAGEGGNF